MNDVKDPMHEEPGQEEVKQETRVFQDRRRKPDWVSNMATVLSVVSWGVALVVWIFLHQAAPEKATMFARTFGLRVRTHWDSTMVQIAFVLLCTSFIICIAAFIFNILRKRRKTDKYKKSVIITGIGSLLGVILFLIQFWSELT